MSAWACLRFGFYKSVQLACMCMMTNDHHGSAAQALAVASRQVGSLAAQTAELQAQQAAHLAWTGRSLVLSSLDSMEARHLQPMPHVADGSTATTKFCGQQRADRLSGILASSGWHKPSGALYSCICSRCLEWQGNGWQS